MNDTRTSSGRFDGLIIEPEAPARAAVIWLHGLGADGHDFAPIVPELDLPERLAVRFLFPHAPYRAITINGGMRMRAWYDIAGTELQRREDEGGVRESGAFVQDLIEGQIARGIPARRIVLAGFSQGGAIALHAGLRYPGRLAGILALSTYLPLADTVATEGRTASRETPILMVHGSEDGIIPLALARRSAERLNELGWPLDWQLYPMAHTVCAEEVGLVADWLRKVLPD
jgi:phospholipase/carboxylesterase